MRKKLVSALEITHPGEVFRQRFLVRYSISIQAAAEKLHMKREQLSRFINGHTAVSHGLALKLEVATGVSARYWLERQLDHDLQQLKSTPLESVDAEPLIVEA